MEIGAREGLLAALLRGGARTCSRRTLFNQQAAAQLGLGTSDWECLNLLQDLGPVSAGQLADVMGLTTGAVTAVVDRLERAGYVTRQNDPDDRRRVIVHPVAERVVDVNRLSGPLLKAAERAFGSYSDDDLCLVLDFQRGMSELLLRQSELLRMEAGRSAHGRGPDMFTPLAGATSGQLEFANGASNVRLAALDHPGELYRASFEGPQPGVRVQGAAVTFRHKRLSMFEWSKHAGSVLLNSTIPWNVVLRGGASQVVVDAQDFPIEAISIPDGASKLEVLLPWPRGSVPVHIGGGVSQAEIRRPAGVPVQLHVTGGATRLRLDGRRFGAIGGEARLATPGWEQASDRYDIDVSGGASRLEISAEAGNYPADSARNSPHEEEQ